MRRLGALHAAANTAALGLYVGSLRRRAARGAGHVGRALSYAGLGVAGALGGHRRAHVLRAVVRGLARGDRGAGAHVRLDRPRAARRLPGGPPDAAHRHGEQRRRPAGRRPPRARGSTSSSRACSHLSGAAGRGAVEDVRGAACLVCPWHGSAFDLDTGEPRRGPGGERAGEARGAHGGRPGAWRRRPSHGTAEPARSSRLRAMRRTAIALGGAADRCAAAHRPRRPSGRRRDDAGRAAECRPCRGSRRRSCGCAPTRPSAVRCRCG